MATVTEYTVTANDIYTVREAINEKLVGAGDVDIVHFAVQNRKVLDEMAGDDEVEEFMDRVHDAEDRLFQLQAKLGNVGSNWTDLDIVELYKANQVNLDAMSSLDPTVDSFMTLAMEAEDRLEQAAVKRRADALAPVPVKKELTKVEYEAQCRGNLVKVLRAGGWIAAADAIEGVLVDDKLVPGYIAVSAVNEAMNNGGADKWHPACLAILKKEIEPRANKEAESLALLFLRDILYFLGIFANAKVSNEELESGEMVLKMSKPAKEWGIWALKALARLMAMSAENPVNALFRKDAELRQKCQNASQFVDYLREQIGLGIQRHRQANAQRKLDKIQAKEAHKAKLAEHRRR